MNFMERYSKQILIAFTAALLILVFANVTFIHAQQQAPLGPLGNTGFPVTTISTQTPTLTGNQMAPGMVLTTFSGATTATTASANDICALFPQYANSGLSGMGFAYDWYMKSSSANTNVIPTAGAGVVIVGLGTTASSAVRHWKIRLDSCSLPGLPSPPTGTVTMYSLETSTF